MGKIIGQGSNHTPYLQLSFVTMKKNCYLNFGWPGSAHDQRVFQNSVVSKNPTEIFFSTQEYLIGDLAYTTTSYYFLLIRSLVAK
jgi:hypothetical protein